MKPRVKSPRTAHPSRATRRLIRWGKRAGYRSDRRQVAVQLRHTAEEINHGS